MPGSHPATGISKCRSRLCAVLFLYRPVSSGKHEPDAGDGRYLWRRSGHRCGGAAEKQDVGACVLGNQLCGNDGADALYAPRGNYGRHSGMYCADIDSDAVLPWKEDYRVIQTVLFQREKAFYCICKGFVYIYRIVKEEAILRGIMNDKSKKE